MPRETKAQREAREREKQVPDEVDAVADEETPPLNGVVVTRQETPEGGILWAVGQVLGNVTVDQVSTGLRLAAKRVDEDLLGQKPG